ncbi:hypothetical protein [Marinobacterium nitratireducens]|uniref:hypothetical protein n=1 Tax=Marinobacterium nitratireducens TaxID=518897 RepID=UPI001E33DE46|nr:hypothetical protein [Marinobacterium nitratireducens]
MKAQTLFASLPAAPLQGHHSPSTDIENTTMTKTLLFALLFALGWIWAGSARAEGIPLLNYSCPGDIELHTDEGGPIYINGSEAETKKFSDAYYEATGSGVTISLSLNVDGTANVSYTGSGGAHGICQPAAGSEQSGGIPLLNYSCPGDIDVHIAKGGPIYINGNETDMKKFSDTYYEGKQDGVTISLTLMPDSSADVSYTAPGGANGICSPAQ